MNDYKLKAGKLGEKVETAYQNIEDKVVELYQKVEDTVVGKYQKIEDAFVDAFLEKRDDGTKEETKF